MEQMDKSVPIAGEMSLTELVENSSNAGKDSDSNSELEPQPQLIKQYCRIMRDILVLQSLLMSFIESEKMSLSHIVCIQACSLH